MAGEVDGDTADAPPVRTFQVDGGGAGAPEQSVNLFRGDVGFSLPLVTLPHRNGLDVRVTAGYGSNVGPVVCAWNASAPTGVLGAGWSLPLEYVGLRALGPATPQGQPVLVALGGARPLTQIGEDAHGVRSYAADDYQFWSIRYFPDDERWEVVTEDGIVRTFGGGLGVDGRGHRTSTGDSVAWRVCWGPWSDASQQLQGQSQAPSAWYLSGLANPYGERVCFSYDERQRPIGPGGAPFTRELVLEQIVDAYGRTVRFAYAPKVYDPGQQVEYIDPHATRPSDDPSPYQDAYDTRCLDSIAVAVAGGGTPLNTLTFEYALENLVGGAQGDRAPLFYKRYLTAVHSADAEGVAPPGMRFTYGDVNDVSPGALASLVHPVGGSTTYDYARQSLPSDRARTFAAPVAGATASVFHGLDYTVVVWYAKSGAIFADVCTWTGGWTTQRVWTDTVSLDPARLEVLCGPDAFGIHYQDSAPSEVARRYRRDPAQLGGWTLEVAETIALGPGEPPTERVAGDAFYVLANPSFAQGGAVQGRAYQWRTRQWAALGVTAPAAGPAALAAGPSHYVVGALDAARTTAHFAIAYLDATGVWRSGASWQQPVSGAGSGLTLASMPWAVMAVVPGTSPSTATAYAWALDESYQLAGAGQPRVVDADVPAVGGEPVWPIATPVITGSMLALGGIAIRYAGGAGARLAPVQQWIGGGFSVPTGTQAEYTFAVDADVVVMSADDNGKVTSQIARFDPARSSAGGWVAPVAAPATGASPAAGGGWLLIGGKLFRWDGTTSGWDEVDVVLPQLDPASVQLLAPEYIAYEVPGSGAELLLLADGAATRVQLTREQLGACGPSTAVTSTAGGSSITLRRIVAGAASGPLTTVSVASAELDDRMGAPVATAYDYEVSSAVLDAASGIAQFTRASTIPGSRDPAQQPYGRTDTWFSNGVPFDTGAFYEVGTPYNYVGVLNGRLLATASYASGADTPVQRKVSWWTTYEVDPFGGFLPAAYARRTKVLRSLDGVDTTTDYEYSPALGLVATASTTGVDSSGAPVVRVETTTRAVEVSDYAAALGAAHLLAPAALTTFAQGPAGKSPVVVAARATTYRDWSSETGGWCWAPDAQLAWLRTGSPTPFGGGSAADWQTTSRVLERGAYGAVRSSVTPGGVPQAAVYDDATRSIVARVHGASAAEVVYCGFEPYEGTGAYVTGKGAAIVDTDAATGAACLSLAPAGGWPGLTATVAAEPGNRSAAFVATGWMKTGAGFAADGGTATWTLTAAQNGRQVGSPSVLTLTDTAGAWAHAELRLVLGSAGTDPRRPVAVTLAIANAKDTVSILVDDVRLTPVATKLGVNVYDAGGRLAARLDTNGQRTAIVRDDSGVQVSSLDPLGRPVTLNERYLSRTGNQDDFAAADPNARLTVSSGAGGVGETFAGGTEWQQRWRAGDPAGWQAAGGALTRVGAGADTLTLIAPGFTGDWAVWFRASAAQPSAGPLAVGAGTALVSWDPMTCRWTVAGAQYDVPQFTLAVAVVQGALAAGAVDAALRSACRGAGVLLTSGTPISRAGGSRWLVAGTASTLPHWLVPDSGLVAVYRLPRRWLVATVGGTLLAYGEGRLIATAPGAGPLSISVAPGTTLRGLCAVADPAVNVMFSDGLDRTRQSQVLELTA